MAVISSHVLDAVKGISAVGIRIELFRLYDSDPSQRLFETHSDSEGRISESVAVVVIQLMQFMNWCFIRVTIFPLQ